MYVDAMMSQSKRHVKKKSNKNRDPTQLCLLMKTSLTIITKLWTHSHLCRASPIAQIYDRFRIYRPYPKQIIHYNEYCCLAARNCHCRLRRHRIRSHGHHDKTIGTIHATGSRKWAQKRIGWLFVVLFLYRRNGRIVWRNQLVEHKKVDQRITNRRGKGACRGVPSTENGSKERKYARLISCISLGESQSRFPPNCCFLQTILFWFPFFRFGFLVSI